MDDKENKTKEELKRKIEELKANNRSRQMEIKEIQMELSKIGHLERYLLKRCRERAETGNLEKGDPNINKNELFSISRLASIRPKQQSNTYTPVGGCS